MLLAAIWFDRCLLVRVVRTRWTRNNDTSVLRRHPKYATALFRLSRPNWLFVCWLLAARLLWSYDVFSSVLTWSLIYSWLPFLYRYRLRAMSGTNNSSEQQGARSLFASLKDEQQDDRWPADAGPFFYAPSATDLKLGHPILLSLLP